LLILVVFLIFPTFVQMSRLREASDETLTELAAQSQGISEDEIQPSDIDELRDSIDEYWSAPWYEPVVQAAASLSSLPVQMALSVIVLGALTRGTLFPLVGAMALHFLAETIPIFAGLAAGIWVWLAVSLLTAGIAVWFIHRVWPTAVAQTQAMRTRRKKK
jgi:hypothetical protein